MRTLLAEAFEVHEYWDESWQGGLRVPVETINSNEYAFFMQVMSPMSDLEGITVPILWAPMYDGTKFNYAHWKALSYFNIKILAFSRKIATWVTKFGMPVLSVQYLYLQPKKSVLAPGNHIFFWYRGGISFDDLRDKLNPEQVDSFSIVVSPDAQRVMPTILPEDIARYKLKIIDDGFLAKEKYFDLLAQSTIFIAPRKKEGIGAFTEALALGKCVIAYDEGTHNEYITHNIDGLLFTETSKEIDLSRTHQLADAAFKRASDTYAQWLVDKKRIVPFILEPYRLQRSVLLRRFWIIADKAEVFLRKTKFRINKVVRKCI